MTTEPPTQSGDNDDPLIGTLIDRRYRVISRLGDGGMGIVYKVEHTYLNKFFAMKVMRPTRDAVERQRFEQEAQLASKIRHKNVVEISDFGVLATGQPYFVMEFLPGHTLGDAIYEGRIDPLLACHIGAQIASGLGAVHKLNIVHRDLKPDNIFLTDPDEQSEAATKDNESGEYGAEVHFVKIMDFGIAKAFDKNLTGTGMTLGTPEYMSPEQATGEKIDWRSDQYSLGCMLYEMLTGELPFTGKVAFEVMNKHLSELPVPLRQRRPELAAVIPPALEQAVLTMMKKKPAARLPSMKAVEQVLREAVTTLRETVQAGNRLPSFTEPKTVVMKPSHLHTMQVEEAQILDHETAPQDKPGSPLSNAETRPLLPAIPARQAPAVPPPAAPAKAAASGRDAQTLVFGSSGERGQTPTPKLIDKLAVRVKGTSAPELSPAPFWQRIPFLHWLIVKLQKLFRRLRGG